MSKKIEPYKDIALIYDEARPSYPEKLIQDIIAATNLKLSDRLLEIGAGTGKATVQFAEKGFTVHAIEIGKDMGDVLREKCLIYPNISLDIASFEDWTPQCSDSYDMIYCAQAFHWLDASIKYKKCYDLLKEDGFLILFWYTASGDETEMTKHIHQEVNEIIKKYVDKYYIEKNESERIAHSGVFKKDERKAEIEASNMFEILGINEYSTEIKNTGEQFLKAQKSVPAFASILDGLDDETIQKMDEEIKSVININGGYVGTLFDFSLYITKKITTQ